MGKWFLKLPNFFMIIKQKNLSLLKKVAHVNFGKSKVINNDKSTIRAPVFPLYRAQVMSFVSNKKKFKEL